MTYGFADWAVRSSLDFAEWFAELAGIPNRFDQFADRMGTKPE